MQIEIKRWTDKSIIFSDAYPSLGEALEEAVVLGVDLSFADLSNRTLPELDLHDAKLYQANFNHAVMPYVNLKNAILCKANFMFTDMRKAILDNANANEANFGNACLECVSAYNANFQNAMLGVSNFSNAILTGANLTHATMIGTNFHLAVLDDTILDPRKMPNQNIDGFQTDGDYVIGYRTRKTSAAGLTLVDNRIYGCEAFSVSDDECHPGWYLWPTLNMSKDFSGCLENYIIVKSRIIDMHKAGEKWRTRAIQVIGNA